MYIYIYTYISLYIYIYTYIHTYIYIYMYCKEKERERERERLTYNVHIRTMCIANVIVIACCAQFFCSLPRLFEGLSSVYPFPKASAWKNGSRLCRFGLVYFLCVYFFLQSHTRDWAVTPSLITIHNNMMPWFCVRYSQGRTDDHHGLETLVSEFEIGEVWTRRNVCQCSVRF